MFEPEHRRGVNLIHSGIGVQVQAEGPRVQSGAEQHDLSTPGRDGFKYVPVIEGGSTCEIPMRVIPERRGPVITRRPQPGKGATIGDGGLQRLGDEVTCTLIDEERTGAPCLVKTCIRGEERRRLDALRKRTHHTTPLIGGATGRYGRSGPSTCLTCEFLNRWPLPQGTYVSGRDLEFAQAAVVAHAARRPTYRLGPSAADEGAVVEAADEGGWTACATVASTGVVYEFPLVIGVAS